MPHPSRSSGADASKNARAISAAVVGSRSMSQPLYSHSSDVQMWLDCGPFGRVDLGRITPKSVVARSYREVPPCFAELVVCVDGRCRRERINLASGFVKGRLAALVYPVDDAA